MKMRQVSKLAAIGVAGGALFTLAILASIAGWRETAHQFDRSAVWVESNIYVHAPLFLRVVAPSPPVEETRVWRSVLEQFGRSPGGHQHSLGVCPVTLWPLLEREAATTLFYRVAEGSAYVPGDFAYAPAVHDFLLKNARAVRVSDSSLSSGTRAVSFQSFYETSELRNGWQQFCAMNHVTAYITLSRVGFDFTGQRALVYVQFSCGPLCGHGSYYTLIKRNGQWHMVGEQNSWVS